MTNDGAAGPEESLKAQYPMSNGVWVIAECERCGRGFVTLGKNITRDPYAPPIGSRLSFSAAPCGGRLVRLEENTERPLRMETQHD